MAAVDEDNITEFCLPAELLANNSKQQEENDMINSCKRLKESSLSIDTKQENDTPKSYHNSCTSSSLPHQGHGSKDTTVHHLSRTETSYQQSNLNSDINSLSVNVTKPLEEHLIKVIRTSAKPKLDNNIFHKQGLAEPGLDNSIDSRITHHYVNDTNSFLLDQPRTPRRQSFIEKALAEEERDQSPGPISYDDADGYVFHDSAYDSALSARFEAADDEWESQMNTGGMVSPGVVSPGVVLRGAVYCKTGLVFVKQLGTSDTLRDQITQVVGESHITVVPLEECFDVTIKAKFCSVFWIQVLSPLCKRASEILSELRSSDKSIVLVTDTALKAKLPFPLDVYVEPLPVETIERLCCEVNVKDTNPHTEAALMAKQHQTVRNMASTPESTISSASGRTSTGSPSRSQSPPRWCRVEHATKEKQRRERIKDSCDQLRVLLPYVKGRKTDMASILEMTVDYLKIVNSALSQDFHSQVIDIMSNGSPKTPVDSDVLSKSMAYKKSLRKEQDGLMDSNMGSMGSMGSIAPAHKSFHTMLGKAETKGTTKMNKEENLNKRMVTRSVSRSLTSLDGEFGCSNLNKASKGQGHRNVYSNMNNGMIITKRESSTAKTGSSKPKKPHMTLNSQKGNVSQAPVASLTIKDCKTESMLEDLPPHSHPSYHNFQFPHMFTEGNVSANRMFSSGHVTNNEGYGYVSHSQINLQSANTNGERSDVNNYGNVYFDTSFLPYSYSNLQDSTNGNYFGTEYVNPNAVIPVTTYTPRVSAFASGRKSDRVGSSVSNNMELMQNESADIYNNNATS